MATLAPGIFAWGVVTGVAMAGSGMGLTLAVAMSLLVFSGSAQLATMPLIVAGAPLWVVWLTALCVNLRFVVFSLTWARYLRALPLSRRLRLAYFTADMNFVLFLRRYPDPAPAPGQVAYLWGTVPLNWGAWQLGSLLGIFGAHLVPPHWGLGFAGALALLGLLCSLLGPRPTWVAAGVAGAAAVAAFALPLKLHIVVAIAAAVAAGAAMEAVRPAPAAPPKAPR
ncbi:MAG: AzlC family ABC transporter permease [Rubrivivax sp.]